MADSPEREIIACHECDHFYYYELIPVGAKANCQHCGNLLYRHIPDSIDRSLALYFTALILFLIANNIRIGHLTFDTFKLTLNFIV